MTRAIVLLAAAGLDAVLGEPRRGHPVRAFGTFLGAVRRLRTGDSARDRRLGAAGLVVGAAGAAVAAAAADRLAAHVLLPRSPCRSRAISDGRNSHPRPIRSRHGLRTLPLTTPTPTSVACGAVGSRLPRPSPVSLARRSPFLVMTLLRALMLKPAFAIRALLDAGETVRSALAAGDLDAARVRLGTHLVSRPVHDLAAHEVAAATIESLAENLTDSVVAPLLATAIAGPAAAWAYRFVNTADAVLGYRTAELRDLGAVPARMDDALNLVPARISAVLIGVAAPAGGGTTIRALRTALSDHARTASPNAGWTMAAMAGALDISLSKRDAYTLNACGRAAEALDVARASRIIIAASGLALVLSTLLAAVVTRRRRT